MPRPPWAWLLRSKAAGPDTRFGFAVVGLGHGAHKFLAATSASPTVRVSALVSRDAAKAKQLAQRFSVAKTYTYAEMDRLIDDPAVQAVYLCLPNSLHREFTELAARAGKHVLCEKPMAPTVADCEAMIAACQQAKRLLMIGYRTRFSSVHLQARQVLISGVLGRVGTVRSGFGFHARSGWRLDPALAGGGSLHDVGIYPIHSIRQLLDEDCTVSSASIVRDPTSGIEMAASWQGTLPSGASIRCQSSYLEKIPDFLEIQAERGTLLLKPAFSYDGLQLHIRARNARDHDELNLHLRTPRNEASAFRLEAEHLAHCAARGSAVITPGQVGLHDMQQIATIEAIASA